MTTLCPKCRHARQATDTAPAWQCPACGVAYAKAADAARPGALHVTHHRAASTTSSTGFPWLKLIAIAAMLWGAWSGYQISKNRSSGGGVSSFATKFGAEPSPEQLKALAATTQADDVLIYSAPWCGNCTEAKSWMTQNGFKYQECNVEASIDCAAQLKRLGSDGVPYLIVKGQHMKDGFDSDQFIAALQKKPG